MNAPATEAAPVVYVDVETTGLDPDRHEVWEVGMVLAGGELERFLVDVTLVGADPVALDISGFHDRHPSGDGAGARASGTALCTVEAARRVCEATSGATLAGANVAFDAAFLRRLLARCGAGPTWNYRLLDVEAYAAGVLGWPIPRGLRPSAEALGVDLSAYAAHTALDDALLAAEIHRRAVNHPALKDGACSGLVSLQVPAPKGWLIKTWTSPRR